jgi:hypothetical protein
MSPELQMKCIETTNACYAQQIAKNALDILINLSDDREILADLSSDDLLLESLLNRLTVRAP